MSSVDIVNSIMEQYGTVETDTSTSSSELDQDAFLNLLVTQMQYQDPLEPTSNEDMLAQMATFSSLEQMQNLNTSFSMQQGYDMVGKTVIGSTTDTSGSTTYVSGTVDYVSLVNGEVYLNVEGTDILVDNVTSVVNDTSDLESLTSAVEDINEALESIYEKLEAIELAAASSEETETDEVTETETTE